MVVLTLLSVFPQLVLRSPNVTLCVFVVWAIMLRLKFWRCVEMVEKYGRLIGSLQNLPMAKAEKKWGYLVFLVATSALSFSRQGNTITLHVLEDHLCHDLAAPQPNRVLFYAVFQRGGNGMSVYRMIRYNHSPDMQNLHRHTGGS